MAHLDAGDGYESGIVGTRGAALAFGLPPGPVDGEGDSEHEERHERQQPVVKLA